VAVFVSIIIISILKFMVSQLKNSLHSGSELGKPEFIVYVLLSEDLAHHYTGMTTDLTRRLMEHNSGKNKSTKAFSPWSIVYSEVHITRTAARAREKYLKSAAGRRFVMQKLIGIKY